jgi:hypothetical protein
VACSWPQPLQLGGQIGTLKLVTSVAHQAVEALALAAINTLLKLDGDRGERTMKTASIL